MYRYRWELLVSLALLLTTAAVFGRACAHQFVNYDDPDYVTENPHVKAGLSGAGLRWAFTTLHAGNWHPLTWLSLQLDARLFGPGPWGFHVSNVLLHIANTVLLFWALRLLTGACWPSAFVAALFALHPLHVESVAWVAERKDVLCGLFAMLALLAYGWYVRQPSRSRYTLIVAAFALGLLAKPMLVTLPCGLLLLDYWPLRRARTGWRELVWEKLPLFALVLCSCVVTWYAQRQGGAIVPASVVPLRARLANVPVAYVTYLGRTVWPANLAAFYPHPGASLPLWQAVGAALLLGAVTALAWRWRCRMPYVLVGWLWYLGMLVPVIGLAQVGGQALADRYTYLPLLGIFLALAWGAADLVPVPWRSRILAPAAALILLLCATATWRQLAVWHDNFALWRHVLASNPDNYLAHLQLAQALGEAGNPDLPNVAAHVVGLLGSADGRGPVLTAALLFPGRLGKLEETFHHFQEAVRLDRYSWKAHYGLGVALEELGDLDGAMRCYREAAAINPRYAEPHNNLGAVLRLRGDLDGAYYHYSEALRLKPELAEAHANLGLILLAQGNRAGASAHFAKALELQPGNVQLRFALERALGNGG